MSAAHLRAAAAQATGGGPRRPPSSAPLAILDRLLERLQVGSLRGRGVLGCRSVRSALGRLENVDFALDLLEVILRDGRSKAREEAPLHPNRRELRAQWARAGARGQRQGELRRTVDIWRMVYVYTPDTNASSVVATRKFLVEVRMAA